VDRRHRESPLRRRYESGEIVWVARYTAPDGRRRIAKPAWNRGFGTFSRRRDAQHAIEEAYGLPAQARSLAEYFATWLERHPRAARTNATYEHRVSRVLDVEIEGRTLGQWPLAGLRRRHALALVDHLLRVQGRAASGAAGILRALSAMAEDAITDELAERNPFKGLRVRAGDPRARKRQRPVRVFGFGAMHSFARAAGAHEAMVRVFTDTGLRLGEVLPLRRADFDGRTLRVRRTAHEGAVLEGTKTDHGERDPGRLVPVPPALAELLADRIGPEGAGEELIFRTPTGRLWRESGFYRSVWRPAREASGIDIRPHECRHSYITHLRRAGIDDADLAQIAGHRLSTMLARYSHALGGSFEDVRRAIG
jgi:integrase